MIKYGKDLIFDPNKLHKLSIDRQSTTFVPNGSRVLEIGCATGFMGEYFTKKKNCTVVGVEPRKEEAKEAQKKIEKVIVGSIEDPKVLQQIPGKFDVIFISAVIQNIYNPLQTLKELKKLLNKDGKLIITCSNISHWTTRLQLMQGKFNYEEYGLLDDTVVRFYTPETFKKLINDAGYSIKSYSADTVGGGYPKVSMLGSIILPSLFTYQMLIVAQAKK